MHLQENTLFLTFDLGFKVTQMLLSALYIMWPIHLQGFRLLSRTNRVGDAFTQEKTLFNLDLRVKVTQNVAQYPLHHVTYMFSPAKFEVAMSNSLGEDPFTRNLTHARTYGQTDRQTDDRMT